MSRLPVRGSTLRTPSITTPNIGNCKVVVEIIERRVGNLKKLCGVPMLEHIRYFTAAGINESDKFCACCHMHSQSIGENLD
eukprot:m.360341 g.360341  ORF g.360341 m.360341 type:complete len:81 (-) comp126330_c0_seq1:60-302(-)